MYLSETFGQFPAQIKPNLFNSESLYKSHLNPEPSVISACKTAPGCLNYKNCENNISTFLCAYFTAQLFAKKKKKTY